MLGEIIYCRLALQQSSFAHLILLIHFFNSSNNNNNNNNNNKKVLIAHLKFSMRLKLHMIKKDKNDKSKNDVKFRNSVLR